MEESASSLPPTPFVKQLVSSDRPTRDKALESLRTFLASNRNFSQLELLRLWKGLFYCMWHSDRPKMQQKLAVSLADLVQPLRTSLFAPFLAAFWTTLANEYHSIDALRLDKFLFLIRNYVRCAFFYLSNHAWAPTITSEYLDIIDGILNEAQGSVSDGLKYHVLDVWIDELDKVDDKDEVPFDKVLSVVRKLATTGRTRTLKSRANETLADERLLNWPELQKYRSALENASVQDSGDEWNGLGD